MINLVGSSTLKRLWCSKYSWKWPTPLRCPTTPRINLRS